MRCICCRSHKNIIAYLLTYICRFIHSFIYSFKVFSPGTYWWLLRAWRAKRTKKRLFVPELWCRTTMTIKMYNKYIKLKFHPVFQDWSHWDEKQGCPVVHCVMHKCILVKLGEGNEKHLKYVKKHVNFTKAGGISKSRGVIIFPK